MDESNSEPSKSSKPVKKPMLTPNTLQKMADPTLSHIMPSRIDYQKAREEMGPPPPKPKKRAVLDEDTYEEIVKKTIERDYFPDAELFRLKDMVCILCKRVMENENGSFLFILKSSLNLHILSCLVRGGRKKQEPHSDGRIEGKDSSVGGWRE